MIINMLISTLILTSGCIIILWVISILIKDISIIDTAFAPIILVVSLQAIYLSDSNYTIKAILFSAIALWSMRLTYVMLQRKLGHGEDVRYTKLREWKKPGLSLNIFVLKQVFLLQGIVIWCVTLPIQFILSSSAPTDLNYINFVGLVVICIGFLWELISDYQLDRFKKTSPNPTDFLRAGLWSYSRHPNYFGEIFFWWGVFIFSIVNLFSLVSVVGPILFTYLIINITGVRTMDKRMGKKYSGYTEYMQTTNAIIPKLFSS